jgi:hypothetical protein
MTTLEQEKAERVLNLQDRCDACNSQAFVLVKLLNGTLVFCGHHYGKFSKKLNNEAYEIVDEREYINEKLSQSSN